MTTPFLFFDVIVLRTRRLSPTMRRITFAGHLDEFASGGRDQRLKLFLPRPHQNAPLVPTDAGDQWFNAWRELDPDERGIMRTYTVRHQRPGEFDLDFAVHGDGPASDWAVTAEPGDRVTVLGPAEPDNPGVDFRPPDGTGWVLIAGDESALPAIGGILADLPGNLRAKVWIEVAHGADIQDLPSAADADITWLVRREGIHLLGAVRAAELPADGSPYAWIAGEAGAVKALRRHLVNERGFDRGAVTFTGYWRLGASEEDLLAEHAVMSDG
ncbi:siderophore-interacting protein [Spirillospora sp. CA-294931]|uniref:siderophore-interacting protein n=1 Tax=Spirillospora sp. CA-294931 TaxID=3240042 RepID=UPI003D9376FC